MLNRRFLFALFAASVPLAGCSKFLEKFSRLDGSTTQVSLAARSQHSLVSSVLTGGIMVYAVRTTDGFRQSIRLNDELSTGTPVTLPNGSYRFVAVGWPEPALNGIPKCGTNTPQEDVVLSGSPVTVSLTMSDGACANDIFGTEPIYRSGSTFNALRMKFCGGAVDISGLSGSSLCDMTRESYRFFAGNSAAAGAQEAEFDPATNRLVYLGDLHELGRTELFSVNFEGKDTVKQNSPTSMSPFDVQDFEVVPGSGKVIYRANQDNISQYEIYISTIGQPGGTKISGAINAGCPSCAGVKDMMVTGNHVVFAGEMDTLGKVEVYSVNLTSLSRVKLSGTANGIGVHDFGSGSWAIDPSPDNAHVVFLGQFDSATDREVYSAPVNGTAASAVKLHGTPSTAGSFTAYDYRISHDSQYVVWSGNYNNNSTQDLFRATIGTANSSTQINPASTGMGAHFKFWLSHNSSKMAFAADVTALPNEMDLYTVDLSNIGGTTVKVHDISTTGVEFHDLNFNSDNTKIAYFADDLGNDVYKVFSAVVGGASSAVNRTHTNALITPNTTGGGYDHGKGPIWIDSNGYVLYEASATPQAAADTGLYQFSLGDANPGTLVTQALAAGKEVNENRLGYGKAFYTIDETTNNVYQLFSFVPGLNTLTELSLLGPRLASVKGAHIPEPWEQLPSYPHMLAVVGNYPGGSSEDIYLIPNHTDLSGIRKVTHAYTGTNGVGRLKLRLLEYRADPGGVVSLTGAGLESACMAGPGTDGGELNLGSEGISFPAGSSALPGLFALAIDVYGEAADLGNDGVANDCVGTPSRVLFPKGLADVGSSPQASRLRLTDSGSPVLFIKD